MECVDTPHFIISIWIQAWIWSMDLHAHSTLHNIHIDPNMDMEYGSTDMDMEYGSTSTLHNIHMDTDMDMDMKYGSTWTLHTS